MDCADIRQGFVTGEVLSGPAVREHVRGCQQCAELVGDHATLGRRLANAAGELRPDAPAQLVAMEALLAKEHGLRAYLRSRPTRVRWAFTLILPALLMLRELARKRVPMSELGTPRLVMGLLLLGVLGLVARSALARLPVERRAARVRWALAIVAWCSPCLLFLAPEAHASADPLTGFAGRSLSCFLYGSALAAPSFALLWALDRGARVSYRVWLLAAGSVAIVANLILMLHCPLTDGAHLLAGHFSIGLAWLCAVSAAEWCVRRAA